jgi:hypothetical protein
MSTLTLVKNIVIRGSSGPVDVEGFFPGKTIVIDPEFQELLQSVGAQYASENLSCRLSQVGAGYADVSIITALNLAKKDAGLNWNHICAALSYLGGDGSSILEIPEGEEEVNVILGYSSGAGGINSVVFVEHEFEHEVEEFHLHVRQIGQWNDRLGPMVLEMEVSPN